MSDPMGWLLIGIAALLTGVFNLPIALQELKTTCRGLLFFEPLKSPGFWLWLVVQLLFPSTIFLIWVTNFFTITPAINFELFFKAIVAGVGFTAFLNARIESDFLKLDIKGLYTYLIRIGYRLIAAQETKRTSKFLQQFRQELSSGSTDLMNGLQWLRIYVEVDILLDSQAKESLLTAINQTLGEPREKQIDAVVSLIKEVRQQDLPDLLVQFGCSEILFQQYFPRQMKKLKPPK
ncbi:MAG: hypothetical protein HC851_07410 [Acaryochloris sp. RU_4_1]|nr:hypothetical protein [Acaryochloris sp. RU_4_1]NJR57111.1 hypothetical protein [Acaryochloris sp. CRU_2_0]